MSPMHQAASAQSSLRSRPKSRLPTAGGSQGRRGGWRGRFTSNAAHGWCGDVQSAAAMGILSGENSCDPCWTRGEHPNCCRHCRHLCKGGALKGGGVTVSSAGHRETLPQAGCRHPAELVSTVTSSSSPSSSPSPATIPGLGRPLTECPPLQSRVLRDLCSPAWQVETASPCHSSSQLCVMEMKIPACFFRSKNQLKAAWCYSA